MVLFLCCHSSTGMPLKPLTAADQNRAAARTSSFLVSTRTVRRQTRDQRSIYLDWFRKWLLEEKKVSFKFLIEQKPPDPERISALLVDYGKELFAAGRSYGIFSETINSVAAARPLIRRQLTPAWDLAFCWLADEPHQHHPALPVAIMTAMCTVALALGWVYEAAVIMMGWAGLMRIGEVLAATRSELVLPCDSAPGTPFALIIIKSPKTRGRHARHQAARIDQRDLIAFLTAVYKDFPKGAQLWPFSASTLRKRFGMLLRSLELPDKKSGPTRPFDLGSLRAGGATWLLHFTEDPEVVRRRGRWLSTRVLEIYLQETLVTTFVQTLKPRAPFLIELLCGCPLRNVFSSRTLVPPRKPGIFYWKRLQTFLRRRLDSLGWMVTFSAVPKLQLGPAMMNFPSMAQKEAAQFLTSGMQQWMMGGSKLPARHTLDAALSTPGTSHDDVPI